MTNPPASPQGSTKKIGAYTVQAVIGRGRFGTVVLAKSGDGRKHAIKILHKKFGRIPAIREALANWVQIINALDSIGIVQIFELGFDKDYPYLVMPVMHGRSLAHKLQKEMLTVEQTNDILLYVATTLRDLHSKELVHGSLHPHNILFHKTGVPLLTDAGLASILAPESEESINLPGYLSPEQIKGGQVDGRTDTYALGVILYEMLTGRPAYTADSPAMITVKQVTTPVENVRVHQPSLPFVYDGLIGRLTSLDPQDRPPNADTMVELVQATLQRVSGTEEIESDLGKDLFDKFAKYTKKEASLEERLAAIEAIRNLKDMEEESSQRRMNELLDIEKERQKTIQLQKSKAAKSDSVKIYIALVILISFILFLSIFFVIQAVK